MKKAIIFSIITLGISSIVAQLVIIRELIISFYGNEFFIGWTLFSWLFWVGMGSLFLNKIIKEKTISKITIICHILIALFIGLEIFLIRFSRILIAGQTGQIPNLIPALFYSFFILAPLCLILGLQFAVVSRLWKSLAEKLNLSQVLGKSYVLETFGFIIGGLIFSYVLIFNYEFLIASVIAWLNLLAGFFILFSLEKSKLILKLLFGLLIVIFIVATLLSPKINLQTNALRFPNQKLIELKNSIYGNIAVTKSKNQYNFYESGLFLGASKEEIFNEYLAHFPLLYHPNPKKILLIGNGFNGILKEILKHQPEEIFYLELDPLLIETVKNYIPLNLGRDLENKKVKIINLDARYFIKNTSENFDVIIINLPNPSTALINRFYTEDFLKQAKNKLNKEGILTTHLSSSANYFGPKVENLDASLYKALKDNFNSVLILPEDEHLFIASQNQLNYNPDLLIQRLEQRNIKTNFLNSAYVEYRLTNDRIQKMLSVLNKNQTAKINQDQLPISYYYNFIYWVSSFYPKLAKVFLSLTKIKFIWILIFLFLFLGIWLWAFKTRRREKTKGLLFLTMALAGFSLMTTEVIIIFGFQIFYGYLYYKIALIITALMVGMTFGSWLGTKKIDQAKIKTLIKIHLLIILFSLILLSIFYFLFKTSPKPSFLIEMIFLISAALIGAIVGFEFPVVNKLYLTETKNALRKTGVIYGADLFGSCLGASLVSIFILPIFGIYESLILLAILNIIILIPLSCLKLTS
jgi:spermidine synthase